MMKCWWELKSKGREGWPCGRNVCLREGRLVQISNCLRRTRAMCDYLGRPILMALLPVNVFS